MGKVTYDEHLHNPPFEYTLSMLEGKWKMRIVFWLHEKAVLRYGELKRLLPNITHKMLSEQLKELETNNIVTRTEYKQVPPKVEYSLTEKGLSLFGIVSDMCAWGHEYRQQEQETHE